MSWHHESEDRTEDAQRVEREIEKRRQRGEPMVALRSDVARGIPCNTFWGRAWCENLQAYSDYGDRLPRGRSYLRGGRVMDLDIMEGEVFAYVAGSGLYEVSIFVEPLAEDRWRALTEQLAGQISNLVDLLSACMGAGVLRAITDRDSGLFPEPSEIRFDCSCPDHADMCKHVAAVLYAVGVKLDQAPDLFFRLRKVDHRQLIGVAGKRAGELVREVDAVDECEKVDGLAAENLAQLFGIELAEPGAAFGSGQD